MAAPVVCFLKDQRTDLEDDGAYDVGRQRLVGGGEDGLIIEPSSRREAAKAATHGMYRMVKARKLKALSGVKICASAALSWASVVEPVEDGQGADHRFLGSEAGDEGGGGAPVIEAKRRKDRCNHRADRGQDAVGAVRHHIEPPVKALQKPDDNRGDEDDGEGLVQKSWLFPHVEQQRSWRRAGGRPAAP